MALVNPYLYSIVTMFVSRIVSDTLFVE